MHHSASDPLSLDLYDQPGHLIRRAQQIAAQLFRDVLGPDVTPVQYAILREILPRRQRRLTLTAEGEAMLGGFVPNVHELHERMLSALEPGEQAEFKRLLRKFVQLHDARDATGASSSD
jgi:hypothetical protein